MAPGAERRRLPLVAVLAVAVCSAGDPAGGKSISTGDKVAESKGLQSGLTLEVDPAVLARKVRDPKGGDPLKRLINTIVKPGWKEKWEAILRGPEVQAHAAWSEKAYSSLRPGGQKTDVERICFQVAWFREGHRGYMLPTDRHVHTFMEACKEAFPSLDKEAARRTRALLESGDLRWKTFESRELSLVPMEGDCSDGRPLESDDALRRDEMLQAYNSAKIRPLKMKRVNADEVTAAFERGEVVRFDATKFLPAEMFNVTVADLVALHPEEASSIPVHYGLFHGYYARCNDPVVSFGEMFPYLGPESEVLQAGMRKLFPWLLNQTEHCIKTFSLADMAERVKNFKPYLKYDRFGHYPESIVKHFNELRAKDEIMSTHELNLRRIPNYAKDSQSQIKKAMRLENLVDGIHSYLWMGITPGEFHRDEYDNMLIQIAEEADLFVASANCSWQLESQGLPRQARWLWWMTTEPKPPGKARVPFYHVRLRPGDGVAIPAASVHRVVVRNSRRIGMNIFFEPKYGKMRWQYSPNNDYVRRDEDYLAVRSLWVQTLNRMWDTKKLPMFYRTTRQEVL